MLDGISRTAARSKLAGSVYIPPTKANFPSLIFGLDAHNVFPGANGTGYAVDYASGAIFTDEQSGGTPGVWGKDTPEANGGAYKFWATQHYDMLADNMDWFPDALGTKNLLMLWVGVNNYDQHVLGNYPIASATTPVLPCGYLAGDSFQYTPTEYLTLGSLPQTGDGSLACVATVFNRGAASDIAAAVTYRTDGSTLETSAASTKTGAANLRETDWGDLRAALTLDNGDVTSGNLYGLWLLGFSNANRKYMDITHLGPILNRMALNPTKGLDAFFMGLT